MTAVCLTKALLRHNPWASSSTAALPYKQKLVICWRSGSKETPNPFPSSDDRWYIQSCAEATRSFVTLGETRVIFKKQRTGLIITASTKICTTYRGLHNGLLRTVPLILTGIWELLASNRNKKTTILMEVYYGLFPFLCGNGTTTTYNRFFTSVVTTHIHVYLRSSSNGNDTPPLGKRISQCVLSTTVLNNEQWVGVQFRRARTSPAFRFIPEWGRKINTMAAR